MYTNLLLPHVIHHNSICTIPHIIHLWYEIKVCTTFAYNYVPFVVNIYKILHVCVPHFLLSLSVICLLYMCYQRMHYTYYIKLKAYFFVYYLFGIIVYEFWFPLNCWLFLEKPWWYHMSNWQWFVHGVLINKMTLKYIVFVTSIYQ